MRLLSRFSLAIFILLGAGSVLGSAATATGSEIPETFESNATRPLALSPDGTRLFAVNTPGHSLEIFSVGAAGLVHEDSILVGVDPVAVAARTNDEVWVVNHLSDSVSVIDVGVDPPRVVRTLHTGDEPRDIVFAGPQAGGGFRRAFVTTARRGQNSGIDPMPTTPGTPRALVYVFDAMFSGASAGGQPEAILELFGDTPRALAVTADGQRVFAAIFHSGNRTTAISEGAVCNGGANRGPCGVDGVQVPGGLANGQVPGGLPAPNANFEGRQGPETGLIVRFAEQDGTWRDEQGRNWTNAVRFDLPDLDVFEIDAVTDAPAVIRSHSGVGTVLYNMVVSPVDGTVFVANTEARNEVRFEGSGSLGTTVRGHLHEARITVIKGNVVRPRHLNKHITALPQGYGTRPMPPDVREKSLATPLGMAISSDGLLYVAAFGSSKIGVFATGELEDDTFVPQEAQHIRVSGGGPAGLVLDEARGRLYALTRFDNAVKVIDLANRAEIGSHALVDPEAEVIREGRRFLYDAHGTSSNGEASCSSCHAFADFDSLAWDLGNPELAVLPNPNPFTFLLTRDPFHPLKGPMTTQTLRGLDHHGPMHWRGDRTAGNDSPAGDPLDEKRAFETFNEAFGDLLGLDEGSIPEEEMSAFADFILRVRLPPNPYRQLDNRDTEAQAAARSLYFGRTTDLIESCDGCHTLNPARGFFGASGESSFENETQLFKIAHLRNLYAKIGMFGMPDVPFINISDEDSAHQGDQIRGYGMLHDGSIDTIFHFLDASVFSLSNLEKRNMEDFMLAFPTTFAPIVGQQVTISPENSIEAGARADLLVERAIAAFDLVDKPAATECDLVVSGVIGGKQRSFLLNADGLFRSDRLFEDLRSDLDLRMAVQDGASLTYTCLPPDWGLRIGLDRDGDGYFNGDELDFGTDPLDFGSRPAGPRETRLEANRIEIRNRIPDNEARNLVRVVVRSRDVTIPLPDGFNDPRCSNPGGAAVGSEFVLESMTSEKVHVTPLPCQNWRLIGNPENPRGYRYDDRQLDDGTVRSIVWQQGKMLKIVLSGKGPTNLDYDLRPGDDEGLVFATLRTGLVQTCVACTAEPPNNGILGLRYRGYDCAVPTTCPEAP